jgi:5-formyltetrahydrofolate cyclo-ligase
MTEDTALIEAKRRLRADARQRRAAAHAALAETAGARLLALFREHIDVPPDTPVAGFWPFRDEIDVRPILEHLDAQGHEVGLPAVVGRGRPLVFRPWRPGMRLAKGRLGEPTPPPDADYGAGEITPRLLLVPLLAFDAQGYRIGYGGGYYDMTLAALRKAGPVVAVGVGYSAQEVDAVPHDENDQRLDWIVTEREARRFGSGG